MTKLMLAAVAALSICFGAKAVTGDLLAHLSFDDSGDILKSTVGADGEVGGSGAVTWVTDETILAGLKAGDGAVLIPVSTHIKLPIPATLTSSSGKPWSISMKVKFPSFGPWYSIFTMPAANNDDMMVYLTQAESPGIVLKQSGGKVYGNGGFTAGQWETLLFLFDSNNTRVLLNGTEIFSCAYTLAGSRADCANAGGYILLAGDNDGEDSPMYWADVKVYDGIVPDTTDLVIHTVTWRNSDGTLLKTDEVVEGKLPVYGATSPVENSDEPSYFTGWAPGFEAVVSNTTYTAAYSTAWNTVDLSTLTANYSAHHGDMLTGTLAENVMVSIADGATVQVKDVTIEGVNDNSYPWAGITCEGDAWLVIEGTNVVKSFYGNYPGIFVPRGKTLTICGTGKLDAYSQGIGAGIGGGYEIACGNIVINSGRIIAHAGSRAAGIGGGKWGNCGNITINGGVVTASGGGFSSAIGGGSYGGCGNITINGGEVYAYGAYGDDKGSNGIGNGYDKGCGTITIGENITKVVTTHSGSYSVHIGGGETIIAENLKQTENGGVLTIEPDIKWDITWRSDEGELIEVTIVNNGATPEYTDQEKEGVFPYHYVFTGWSPALGPAVSNTTYTAAFKKVANISQLKDDWTAEDGDEIEGTTAHKVTIPSGATVTINGVSVAGAGGGAEVPAPAFTAGGASEVVKFAQAEGGKWTITAFAEMSNESRGTDVTASQLKVYRASSLEGLKTAEAMTSGVTLTEKTSAVKVTLEAEAPTDAEQQFFRVDFGE